MAKHLMDERTFGLVIVKIPCLEVELSTTVHFWIGPSTYLQFFTKRLFDLLKSAKPVTYLRISGFKQFKSIPNPGIRTYGTELL